jgi:hypothetical protein
MNNHKKIIAVLFINGVFAVSTAHAGSREASNQVETPTKVAQSLSSSSGGGEKFSRSGGSQAPNDEQMQIYLRVRGRSWAQLNDKEKYIAASKGIPNEETYNAWKAQQEARLNPPPAPVVQTPTPATPFVPPNDEAIQVYMKVKDRSWNQLNAQEKQYAMSKGIGSEAAYNTWKTQQEARLHPPVAVASTPTPAPTPVVPPVPAPKPVLTEAQKKELQVYNSVKDKDWDALSSREIDYAFRHGVHNRQEFEDWKLRQSILAADAPPIITERIQADVAVGRTQNSRRFSSVGR